MTDSKREEIVKAFAERLYKSMKCENLTKEDFCRHIEDAFKSFSLTQVAKSRREVYERCAKIAEEYHWEIKWRGEPKKETKVGITGEEIARAIRNKLNQKGEQNGKSN